jgi:hypothetical protein
VASLQQEAAKVDVRVWSIHQPQRLLQAVLGLADSSLPDGAVIGYRVRRREEEEEEEEEGSSTTPFSSSKPLSADLDGQEIIQQSIFNEKNHVRRSRERGEGRGGIGTSYASIPCC